MKNFFLFLTMLAFTSTTSFGQYVCNVVDGSGLAVRTSDGGYVVHDSYSKCKDGESPMMAKADPKPKDSDGDGVMDTDDKCPTVKGMASNSGCPEEKAKDSDNDGVIDAEDACPTVAGPASLKGCPDSDNDGITDKDDLCPNTAGKLKGCPDRDSDTVADKDDKCPDVAGIVANKGCPEVEESEKKVFEEALQGIQFETGKAVIKRTSYSILDNIVAIMKKHNEYNLNISGHTDNTGKAESNLTLSDARAKAAMQYLVDKGVDSSRLKAKGFGITQPVADNNTAAGRAKNRRVEFKVEF